MARIVLIGIGMFFFALPGYGDEKVMGIGPGDALVGTWSGTVTEKTEELVITVNFSTSFNTDMTWSSSYKGTVNGTPFTHTVAGTYTATTTAVITTAISCTEKGQPTDCPETGPKSNSYSISGNTLTITEEGKPPFTLIKD